MKKICIALLIIMCCFIPNPDYNKKSNVKEFLRPIYQNSSIAFDDLDFGGQMPSKDYSIDNLETNKKFELNPINVPELYRKEHYSTYYFNNLRNNMGSNYIGSCSYVAVGMMLSYYDSYWNDRVISDDYEQKSDVFCNYLEIISESPGIKEDINLPYIEEDRLGLEYGISLSYDQYYQLVVNNASDYLHYKLMEMGREKEIYKLYSFFDINPFGLGLDGRSKLIEAYLYDYMDFLKSEISYEVVTTNVENYIISKVNEGIPVLISVAFPDGTGHALVAYDYDYATGKIFANMGWGDGYTHIDLSSLNYSYIKNATTFFVDIYEHSHSDNYVDSMGTTYCSCYFSCHPNHEHAYEYYDENQHIYSCNCVVKDENKVEHNWQYTSNIIGGHTKTCSDCGYSKSESHVYEYSYENADTHKGTCSLCGYESIEDHYFNCTYVDADTHSGVCRECGYAAVLEHSYEYKAIDSTYHILTCKCGATSGTSSKHLWTAALEDNVVKCKTCARTKILAPGEMIPIIKTKPIIIEEETE